MSHVAYLYPIFAVVGKGSEDYMIEQKHMLGEDRQGEVLEMPHEDRSETQKLFYIESYGCAMNFSDSEIVASVLSESGYGLSLIHI